MQNLNNLIPAGSPYQIQYATAINDKGQIVANAYDTRHLPNPRPAADPGLTIRPRSADSRGQLYCAVSTASGLPCLRKR